MINFFTSFLTPTTILITLIFLICIIFYFKYYEGKFAFIEVLDTNETTLEIVNIFSIENNNLLLKLKNNQKLSNEELFKAIYHTLINIVTFNNNFNKKKVILHFIAKINNKNLLPPSLALLATPLLLVLR